MFLTFYTSIEKTYSGIFMKILSPCFKQIFHFPTANDKIDHNIPTLILYRDDIYFL